MIVIKDQIGRTIALEQTAKAIVSLVPSLTELLADLHLDEEVVGITKFCIHPHHWKMEKKIIGGTKQFHADRIKELAPDLVIANKEENTKEAIEELSKSFTVYVSDIQELDDCYKCILDIGLLTAREIEAKHLVQQLKEAFHKLPAPNNKHKVAYCIWKAPWMFAGKETFINTMLEKAGFINVIDEERYPTYSLEEIEQLNPSAILLSSEPYPFKEQHLEELKTQFPRAHICLVDGELFSWYGSRLLLFPNYISSLLKELKTS